MKTETHTTKRTVMLYRISKTSVACIVLAGLMACAPNLNAQQTEPGSTPAKLQFGVYGGGVLAPNSAEFSTLPGLISCQGDTTFYGGSTGGGFSVAAVVGMLPGSGDGFLSHLGFSVKVGLTSTNSTFEADERIGQSISPTGDVSEVVSRYSLESGLSTLIVEPTAFYRVSSETPLLIGLGPTLGFLVGATYDQKEEIASPAGARFADGRTERNVRSGDLEETSGMLLGAELSLAYDIKASPLISIRPELGGRLSFIGPVSDADWKQHGLRAGVSILFTPAASQSTPLGD